MSPVLLNGMEIDNNNQEELTLLDIFQRICSQQEAIADLFAELRHQEGIVKFKTITQEGDVQFTYRIS